jgi:hypothetical protein
MADGSRDDTDPYRLLAEYSGYLNGIREPDLSSKPFYEWMSGALIWRDETRTDTPTRVVWALRPIWAYRTSLMLGEPRAELAEAWRFGREHFPNWVGFLSERREAREEWLEIYRKGEAEMREALHKAE